MNRKEAVSEKRFCKGPDGTTKPGTKILKIYTGDQTSLVCPNLKGKKCIDTGRHCIFEKKLPPREFPVDTCRTSAGILQIDKGNNQVVQSPHIGEKHAPIELTSLQTDILARLMNQQGSIVVYEDLPTTQTNLKKNVSELNKILKDPNRLGIAQDPLIMNVTNEGYFIPLPKPHTMV